MTGLRRQARELCHQRGTEPEEAWRVITLDSDGLRDFSVTADAFWNSFKAFFIVAPMYLYSSQMGARLSQPPVEASPMFASFALLALLWVAWPWAMITVSHMLGVQRNYVRYVIAYNWTTVYVVAAIIPVLLLRQADLIGAGLAALLSLVVIGWSLFIRWYVARKTLEVDGMVATVLVARPALVAADLALPIGGSFLI
jgi:hypothetical protein